MGTAMDRRRRAMVSEHLAARGIRNRRVLDAMGSVPREDFVPADMTNVAYGDGPLSIGWGQTISQPYVVALALEALDPQPDDLVLDVGTGSGYAAAVVSLIAGRVVSIERIPELVSSASERLSRLGLDNIEVVCGDGSVGWPAEAPYDAVCVSAAGPNVPRKLIDQLAQGGRLVMPVEAKRGQVLVAGTLSDDGFVSRTIADVRFVPLLGAAGHHPTPRRGTG